MILRPSNIDFDAKDAREQLELAGYSENECDEMLGAHVRRASIITAFGNRERGYRIAMNSFATVNIGWINCDQFYDDPKAKEANIVVSVNKPEEYDFIKMSLIVNNRNIGLQGTLTTNSEYTFTGKAKPYTKLPVGEKATVVALSYKNDKPYIGIKEFVISEEESFEIELTETTVEEIDKMLKYLK